MKKLTKIDLEKIGNKVMGCMVILGLAVGAVGGAYIGVNSVEEIDVDAAYAQNMEPLKEILHAGILPQNYNIERSSENLRHTLESFADTQEKTKLPRGVAGGVATSLVIGAAGGLVGMRTRETIINKAKY